jgi:tetratricopeptide (TPR) repeat protein
MQISCPSCARPAAGRFCSECGTALVQPSECRACSASLTDGARFCNECGAPVGAVATNTADPGAATTRTWLPWAVSAIAVVALAGVLLTRAGPNEAGTAAFEPPAMPTPTGAAAVDLSSMSPLQAADRLFERVMRSLSAGDSAGAIEFTPMAIQAYGRLDELDADAHYHLGALHLLLGETGVAREHANAILEADPDHLFGLFIAAQAARDEGAASEASVFYRRFLDSYPSQIARDLPEYQAHAPGFAEMRSEAQEYVR